MSQKKNKKKIETRLSHTIHFDTGCEKETVAWDQLKFKKCHSYGPFSITSYIANIKVYPNGNTRRGRSSLYVQLLPKQGNPSEDNQAMVLVTITSEVVHGRTINAPLSKFATGWGVHELGDISHITACKFLNVTIEIGQQPDDTEKMKSIIAKQNELLYELGKANGDITLIICKNDIEVGSGPPLKRRRLNVNNNNNNNNNNNSEVQEDEEQDIEAEVKNEMKVSGIILQSVSSVFNAMLSTDMMEKKKKIIKIKAESIEDIDNMYYCIVTHKLRKDANAKNILVLADLYQIDILKYECSKRMLNDISVDNCIETIHMFDRYAIKDGYNLLIRFARRNINKLTKKDNFDTLSHSLKMVLLR